MKMDLELGGLIVLALITVFNAGVSWRTLQELTEWKREADQRIRRLELHTGCAKDGVTV